MSAPVLDPPLAPAEPLRVQVRATDAAVRAGVLALLHHPDVMLAPDQETRVDTVVVAAGPTVDAALAVGRPARSGARRLVVVADSLSRDEVLRALDAGVGTMIPFTGTGPDKLVAALHAVRDGDGRMPHEVLVRLLGGVRGGVPTAVPAAGTPRLTARQVAVLRLMADGFGNSSIARSLTCSEHTVKNVIYELMARLHARNRAHAVAAAVRLGLI